MTDRIRVLVVDDEPHARRGMRSLLESESDVSIVGEAADGAQAVARIKDRRPDLVFLDVTMPGRSGLGVIDEVGAASMPRVIFVSAYAQYAIPAFDSNAVDYVLKPFTDERFRLAVQRARQQVHMERSSRRTPGSGDGRLTATRSEQGFLERFTLKDGDILRVFRVEQINWIEADEYYIKFHIGDARYLVRATLSALEKQLPPHRFARIHRSTIVNVEQVAALEPLFQGDCTVVLKDGTRLRMSRRRRESLSRLIRTFS